MRGALAAAAAILPLALAGCGGGDDEVYGPEARATADGFVRALVANGNPRLAATYASGDAKQHLDLWHAHFVRDGVRTVEGPGSARSNCVKPFPVFAPPRAADCIIYRLVGLMPIGESPRTLVTTARFRVWLTEADGRWRVSEFDYAPHLETR
jgi:hypothetical protein